MSTWFADCGEDDELHKLLHTNPWDELPALADEGDGSENDDDHQDDD